MNVLQSNVMDVRAWKEKLMKKGNEGGFSAMPIDFKEERPEELQLRGNAARRLRRPDWSCSEAHPSCRDRLGRQR